MAPYRIGMRVLLVEPDPQLSRHVETHLRSQAIEPVVVRTAEEALSVLSTQDFEVVVTELDLPDGDGASLCRVAGVSVLVLADGAGEDSAVRAFRAGADDFVSKRRLSVRELALRIRALRRVPLPAAGQREIRLGPLRVLPATGAAWIDERPVDLTDLEVRLLDALASRPGRVMTRGQLLAGVWGGDTLQERTVDSAVKRLRARIGTAGRWIETVRGVGYRTRVADVE